MDKMKNLLAIVESYRSPKLSRPEARVIKYEKQNQLIFERVVQSVNKNSKACFLEMSFDKYVAKDEICEASW